MEQATPAADSTTPTPHYQLATGAMAVPSTPGTRTRAVRRIRQAADALRARPSAADDARYRELIGDAAWAVAQHLSPYDRLHHLRAYDWLVAQAAHDADLLHAALLHDIGKVATGVRVTLVHRAAHVLFTRLHVPRAALRRTPGLRTGLQVLEEHPERGAALAASFGASPRTVQLIAWHHSAPADNDDPLLRALHAADHSVGA